MQDPSSLGEEYYRKHGLLESSTPHLAELEEALGPIESPKFNSLALEIGCGVSPYCEPLAAVGWDYIGVDPSIWAAQWMEANRAALVRVGYWETEHISMSYDLILCAHALEHMKDAPSALDKISRSLISGGPFYLVVPDDEDKLNPDHLWFFSKDSLRKCIDHAGLVIESLEIRRRVKHENFIYVKARKP